MSRLIAIDTSTPQTMWCGVEDGTTVDPVYIEGVNKHDTVLADGVSRWLDEHGWRDSLTGVAVVVGPGGFTGLRVGVAFATGLAEALQVPVVPVETARMLAARVDEGFVWAIHRAGGQRVKGQVVRAGSKHETVTDLVEFVPKEHVPLPNSDDPLLPLGDGYIQFHDPIEAALAGRLRRDVTLKPLSDALAAAATQVVAENGAVSPLDVDVVYGSEFQPTPKPRA